MTDLYDPQSPGFASRIEAALQNQLQRYPHLQLRDLYKSFFQDAFGPGHLLDSPKHAIEALEAELAVAESQGRYQRENCGIGANFCRLSLDLILDKRISIAAYIDAFLQSAETFRLPSVPLWHARWQAIVPIIASVAPAMEHFSSDRAFIDTLLASGRYQASHSAVYRTHYNPRYRIFSLASAEALLSSGH
ncbi:MAG TPA: hypothetical protein VFC80_01325 [Sphaerochaeta sp.]|nr:hypothetical protein [Sphaerochaeta sp.]